MGRGAKAPPNPPLLSRPSASRGSLLYKSLGGPPTRPGGAAPSRTPPVTEPLYRPGADRRKNIWVCWEFPIGNSQLIIIVVVVVSSSSSGCCCCCWAGGALPPTETPPVTEPLYRPGADHRKKIWRPAHPACGGGGKLRSRQYDTKNGPYAAPQFAL